MLNFFFGLWFSFSGLLSEIEEKKTLPEIALEISILNKLDRSTNDATLL